MGGVHHEQSNSKSVVLCIILRDAHNTANHHCLSKHNTELEYVRLFIPASALSTLYDNMSQKETAPKAFITRY